MKNSLQLLNSSMQLLLTLWDPKIIVKVHLRENVILTLDVRETIMINYHLVLRSLNKLL